MRILCRRRLPGWRWLRVFFLPDPRCLGDITKRFECCDDSHQKSIEAAAYSEVVSRICIGITTKTTRTNRMHAMDVALTKLLDQSSLRQLKLLDIGASDGTSTLAALIRLKEKCRIDAEAIAMDLYVELSEFKNGVFREYRLNDGYPVLFSIGPFAIQMSSVALGRRPWERAIGFCLSRLKSLTKNMVHRQQWSLLNPSVACEANVRLIQGNAFELRSDFVDGFDIVRASNVLNLDYFTADLIRRGISAAMTYVREGGFLVISRNVKSQIGEIEHGTIWRRRGAIFEVAATVGNGSEVAKYVDA